MQPLRRPRHLIATALVFLLFGGVGAGVLGVQAADEASGAARVTDFTIPLPAQGDRGNYTRVEEGTNVAWVAEVEEDTGISFRQEWLQFQWFEDRNLPTPDGFLVESNRLRYHTGPDRVNGVRGPIMAAGAFEPYAHEWVLSALDEDREEVDMRYEYNLINPVPCMLRNSLQGHTFEVTAKPIHVAQPCTAPGSTQNHLQPTWLPVGIVEGATPPVIILRANFENPTLAASREMWLQDGLAYPLRVVDFWEETHREDARWSRTTYSLNTLHQGIEPISTEPTSKRLPALGVVTAPYPNDGALEMHFPLAGAVDQAWQDEATQSWLQARPDAYLAHADHFPYEDRYGQRHDIWMLAWSTGAETWTRQVEQTTGPIVVGGLLVPLTALPADAEPEYTVESTTHNFPESFPAPGERASIFPHIEDLEAQWNEVVKGVAHEPADTWGFSLACDAAPCHARVWLGQERFAYDVHGPLEEEDDRPSWFRHTMSWNDTTIDGYSEMRHAPGEGANEPWIQPATEVQVVEDRGWLPLTAKQALGLSVGAFLAAGLYYLAPLLKQGALAGFSRIKDDEVLEHPVRRQTLELIQAEPGIHHRELVRRVGIGQGAVTHHLRRLQSAGNIDRVQQGRYACYFAKGQVDRRVQAAAPVLRPLAARDILRILHDLPASTGPDLLKSLSVGQSTMQYHLKRLREAGLVESVPQGKRLAWHLTSQGAQAVQVGLHT